MWKARISVPSSATAGDVVTIKTLISHPMETGFRRTAVGESIPRNILTSFVCLYNEREAFRAEFHPAVAANPFLSFHLKVDVSGTLVFRWQDQHGEIASYTRDITVTT
jgi:sulfur-oxidizing protein SoxZ